MIVLNSIHVYDHVNLIIPLGTFTLFGVQAFLGVIATIQAPKSEMQNEDETGENLIQKHEWGMAVAQPTNTYQRRFTSIEKSFSMLFVTVTCNSLTLTAFYWFLSSYQNMYYDNIIRHGGNVPLLLLDIAVSRKPIHSSHLPASLICSLLCLIAV